MENKWITTELNNDYLVINFNEDQYFKYFSQKELNSLISKVVLKKTATSLKINLPNDPTAEETEKRLHNELLYGIKQAIISDLNKLKNEIDNNSLNKTLSDTRDHLDKKFDKIKQNSKIKGIWKNLDKLNSRKRNLLLNDTIHIIKSQIAEKMQYIIISNVGENINQKSYNIPKDILVKRINKIVSEKIEKDFYEPTYEKYLTKKTTQNNLNSSQIAAKKSREIKNLNSLKHTTTPLEKNITLSSEQQTTLTNLIEYFANLAVEQKKDITYSDFKRNIPRLLLSKKKNENVFKHLAKRYELRLPKKGDENWKNLKTLMSACKEYGWSQKEEKIIADKEISAKKEEKITPPEVDKKEIYKQKLFTEIMNKELFNYNDFLRVIKIHEGFTTNEKAFKSFQKEFKFPNKQKEVLLEIINRNPKKITHPLAGTYYKMGYVPAKSWRVVATSNQNVKLFFSHHNDYDKRIKNKGFN